MAYRLGAKHMESFMFYRYHHPLRVRHSKLLKAVTQVTLEATAPAQQRNVKLTAENAVLRGKALHYARCYRAARRRLKKKPFNDLMSVAALFVATKDQLDREKRRRAS